MDGSRVFDNYIYSYRQGAYCAFELHGKPYVLCKDDRLVEDCLVDFVDKISSHQQLYGKHLKIYLSYSSVSRCVDALIGLCARHNMSLEIVSANPYRLHRVTCAQCTQYSTNTNRQWYVDNTEGVKKLIASGIKARGFCWPDWQQLTNIINSCYPSTQGQQLVYTYEVYSSMYPGGHSDHGNTPTREKDDENVALDFAAIPYLKYNSHTGSFDYTGPKMVKM